MKILKARSRKNRIIKGLRNQLSDLREDYSREMRHVSHQLDRMIIKLDRARDDQEMKKHRYQARADSLNKCLADNKKLQEENAELLEIKRKYYSLIRTLKT